MDSDTLDNSGWPHNDYLKLKKHSSNLQEYIHHYPYLSGHIDNQDSSRNYRVTGSAGSPLCLEIAPANVLDVNDKLQNCSIAELFPLL